jgi:hypothetical protein
MHGVTWKVQQQNEDQVLKRQDIKNIEKKMVPKTTPRGIYSVKMCIEMYCHNDA